MSTSAISFMGYCFNSDKCTGIVISVVFHLILLVIGGVVLIKPVEYGIEHGVGGVEIQLVAAPAEVVAEFVFEKVVEPEPVVIQTQEVIPLPEPEKVQELQSKPLLIEEKKPVLTKTNVSQKGDGSSSVAGKEEVSFQSAGGALTEAKPNYLKNPPPAYPYEARQKGWEGIVHMKVLVGKDGKVAKVGIKKGSGHSLLDEATLKAVKNWKFHPAKLGDVPIENWVEFSVVFNLKK